jgi:hypothetical protein
MWQYNGTISQGFDFSGPRARLELGGRMVYLGNGNVPKGATQNIVGGVLVDLAEDIGGGSPSYRGKIRMFAGGRERVFSVEDSSMREVA